MPATDNGRVRFREKPKEVTPANLICWAIRFRRCQKNDPVECGSEVHCGSQTHPEMSDNDPIRTHFVYSQREIATGFESHVADAISESEIRRGVEVDNRTIRICERGSVTLYFPGGGSSGWSAMMRAPPMG